jgi:hypothetical protein
MADFHLIEPFEIGQHLHDISAIDAFAFGVEWECFRRRLLGGAPFSVAVQARNASLCELLASRHGRFVEAHPHGGSMICLVVGGEGS